MARRKDGVDEKYRDRYRRWAGQTYKGKHPSHLVQGEKNVFPHNQLILGYCLLCPMTRNLMWFHCMWLLCDVLNCHANRQFTNSAKKEATLVTIKSYVSRLLSK